MWKFGYLSVLFLSFMLFGLFPVKASSNALHGAYGSFAAQMPVTSQARSASEKMVLWKVVSPVMGRKHVHACHHHSDQCSQHCPLCNLMLPQAQNVAFVYGAQMLHFGVRHSVPKGIFHSVLLPPPWLGETY